MIMVEGNELLRFPGPGTLSQPDSHLLCAPSPQGRLDS